MAKVVVVEDETVLREMIVEEIAELGHEVLQAADGIEGLKLILEHKPRFVCCDVNMPKMNGHELKDNLNKLGVTATDMTFIFVSAKASRGDVADGLMLGADHYFTKPIDFDRLARVLTA